MALAFVSSGSSQASGSTTLTYAVDCTGANILVVGLRLIVGSSLTSVTYNGVSMTAAVSNAAGNPTFLYYLVNPASGSNNVVVTQSGTTNIASAGCAYSGASTTGQPNAFNDSYNGSASSLSVSVTSTVSDCFMIAFGTAQSGGTLSQTSSGTTRENLADRAIMFESAAVTPAGSFSSSFSSTTGSNALTIVAIAIKPSASSSVNSNFLQFFI